MEIQIKTDCSNVDWECLVETLKLAGLAHRTPEVQQQAFQNSFVTIFAYHHSRLIGCGRAISDGICQAAVYDLAVHPDFQKQGVGKNILQNILQRLPDITVILFAAPGKEPFYDKNGFRKMKTGMARFTNNTLMADKGFIE